jgi:hypothetical protein
MNRKSFILTLAAGFTSLFIQLPRKKYVLYGDGIHDDTEALQAWFNGDYEDVCHPDGSPVGKKLWNGKYRLTGTLHFGPKATSMEFCYNQLNWDAGVYEDGLFQTDEYV